MTLPTLLVPVLCVRLAAPAPLAHVAPPAPLALGLVQSALLDTPAAAILGRPARRPPPLLQSAAVPPLLPRTAPPLLRTLAPDAPAAATLAPAEESTRSAQARAHYGARRYVEAARAYESLFQATAAPKYLFNAGMARVAAEHDAAAILHWRAYLAAQPDISPGERAMLETELAAAQKRTAPLRLTLPSALPAGATLTLTAPDAAPQGPRDPISLPPATQDLSLEPGRWQLALTLPGQPAITGDVTLAPGQPQTLVLEPAAQPPDPPPTRPPPAPAELTLGLGPPPALAGGIDLRLDGPTAVPPRRVHTADTPLTLPPGTWTLHAQARGYLAATHTLTLAPAARERLALALRRDPRDTARLALGLSLGASALVFTFVSVPFIARGARHDFTCLDAATCQASANATLDLSTGLALLGTGLGAAVPAITAGLGPHRRALAIEAAIGAGLFAGGLGRYVADAVHTTALDHRPREHASAALLGLGAGMLGGAAVAWIVHHVVGRRVDARKTRPAIAPHARGVSFSLTF